MDRDAASGKQPDVQPGLQCVHEPVHRRGGNHQEVLMMLIRVLPLIVLLIFQ